MTTYSYYATTSRVSSEVAGLGEREGGRKEEKWTHQSIKEEEKRKRRRVKRVVQ